jgi:hypothetical protein
MIRFPSERTWQMITQNLNLLSPLVNVSAISSKRLLNQSDNSIGFEITNSAFSMAFAGGLVFFKNYPTPQNIQDLRRMMDVLTDSLIEETL